MIRRHSALLFSFFFLLLCPLIQQPVVAKVVLKQQQTTNHTAGRHTSRQVPDLTKKEKEWNILIDIAGNNNLHRFVGLNLTQMEMIGSNSNINIICQVDRFGDEKLSRVEVHKGVTQTVWSAPERNSAAYKNSPRTYMSGTQESVESFLEWAIQKYPARKQFVIFWNHGSGFIDPANWGRLITDLHQNFFAIDPVSGQQKLNRETLLTEELEGKKKGLQFNDISGTFLSTPDLSEVLGRVSKSCLGGKPFDIVGMDACCMAGIEVATQLKGLAQYVVFSQEVELGAGWNYSIALKKASQEAVSAEAMTKEIVKSYEYEYTCLTPDYTLSVIDYTHRQTNTNKQTFAALEEKIGELALFLIELISGPQSKKVVSRLSEIRRKSQYSTWFYDNNYIDLQHFLTSLQSVLLKAVEYPKDKERLMQLTSSARTLLQSVVPTYVAGASFGRKPTLRARGLSIYFPLRSVHSSYRNTLFSAQAATKSWASLLYLFLATRDAPTEA